MVKNSKVLFLIGVRNGNHRVAAGLFVSARVSPEASYPKGEE